MDLRRTPLYDRHAAHDPTFTDFGGWEMPVSFDSIKAEHGAVREDVGAFDVSHMGEIEVTGPDALRLCQQLTTNDVEALDTGRAHYAAVTDEDGVILDDIMLYRLEEDRYLFVPNAGKDEWMYDRWTEHRDGWGLDADIDNRTSDFGMLAVQGPSADTALGDAGVDTDHIDRRDIVEVSIDGVDCWVSGTGYTGENGYEILAPWDDAGTVDAAIDATRCGLGARDTLRLEMGYLLAGNEFDHESNPRTPLEARIDFAVDLEATPHFVGHDVLVEQRDAGPDELLVGFRLEDRGVPRSGYAITDGEGTEIGAVTSGTVSPTLGEPIGLGYVESAFSTPETTIAVDVRGTERMARIVTPPFVG